VDAAQAAPPASEGASVQVLVNLNVRAEARDDAEVVGVVPSQTCVTTELCLTATDGAWCCAKFGERTGWMRKLALRQKPLGHRHLRQLLPQAGRLDFRFN
jgi:SH3-like domain-containing protein